MNVDWDNLEGLDDFNYLRDSMFKIFRFFGVSDWVVILTILLVVNAIIIWVVIKYKAHWGVALGVFLIVNFVLGSFFGINVFWDGIEVLLHRLGLKDAIDTGNSFIRLLKWIRGN